VRDVGGTETIDARHSEATTPTQNVELQLLLSSSVRIRRGGGRGAAPVRANDDGGKMRRMLRAVIIAMC